MSKILITLVYCANDAVLAERLLEHIYRLNGKKAVGHILLVANPDCHAEQRQKIRITAEMAFESVTETVAPQLPKELANHKIKQMNNLFRHAAHTAQTMFRWPWLWLEADCVPLAHDWIARLAEAYDSQPRKYVGMVSKNMNDKQFMARCGIYYGAAFHELDRLCQGESPFAVAGAEKIVSSATHTPLVDYLPIESADDLVKVSPKAVLLHGDKQGIVAENWKPVAKEHEFITMPTVTEGTQTLIKINPPVFTSESKRVVVENGNPDLTAETAAALNGQNLKPRGRGRPPKVQPTEVPL